MGTFKVFFFIFEFQHCVCDVSSYGFLLAYLTWASLSLNLKMYVFHQIWDVSSHYFVKYFFCLNLVFPLSGSLIIQW